MTITIRGSRKEERVLIRALQEKVRESTVYADFSDFIKDSLRSKGRELKWL